LVCFPAVETAGYSHSSLRDKEILSNEIFQKNKTELVHRSCFWSEKAVNNLRLLNENCIDLTGCFEFFTGCSHARFGE